MKFVFLFLLTFFPLASLACSATPPGYVGRTTAEKVEETTHIILGRRYLEGLDNIFGLPAYDYKTGKPSTTKIEVLHVLKGNIDKEIITVSTSFGMCGHAFLYPDDEPQILLLGDPYKSNTAYPPNGGYIDSPGIYVEKNEDTGIYEIYEHIDQDSSPVVIPVEAFIKKHNLNAMPNPLNK